MQTSPSKAIRVVIIGGGPGGTACALALQRFASNSGQQVAITLLEGKRFYGERHYNQCVGVLSPPLPHVLKEQLDIDFPHHLVRGKVVGYVLHAADQFLDLGNEHEPSFALRRVQFDAFMLHQVQEHGIQIREARAVDLEFQADHVIVYTESAPVKADVVVGAFGMDEGSAAMFSRQTGYQPPRALSSIVTKYHPGSEAMHAFGNYIHAFLPQHALIEFGAVTPKKNHLTINIAGGAVSSALMEEFLARPDVSSVLRNIEAAGKFDPHDFRFFKGRFPCSTALNYYGDRYVMIGDAAGLVRAFKGKGVNSAVITGIRAADTIIRYGTSKEAFATHYHKANQDILHDLPYGRIARILTIGLARTRLISMVIKAARYDPDLRSSLFDAVSAGDTYQSVLARALSPKTVWRVLRELANPYPTQLETSDR